MSVGLASVVSGMLCGWVVERTSWLTRCLGEPVQSFVAAKDHHSRPDYKPCSWLWEQWPVCGSWDEKGVRDFWEQPVAVQEVWPQGQEQSSELFKASSWFLRLRHGRKSSQREDSVASPAFIFQLWTHTRTPVVTKTYSLVLMRI